MSQPKKPQELYRRVAEKLNLPEDYVKDVVEHYYKWNLSRMHVYKHVAFGFSWLGRFIVRPFKFWDRADDLKKLLESFSERKDDRGLMINRELRARLHQMDQANSKVQELFDIEQKRRYGRTKIKKDSGDSC